MNQFITDEQKLKERDRILTELFQSGIIQEKAEGATYRHFINRNTHIHEDVVGETFLHLCKVDPSIIIDAYYDGGNCPAGSIKRIIGMGVRLMTWKGVGKPKKGVQPKHSIARYILHQSNLNQLFTISPTESGDSDYGSREEHFNVVVADNNGPTDEQKLWELIRENLSEQEKVDLNFFLEKEAKPGPEKKEVQAKYERLLQSIEHIIIKHKIFL